jgi:hypothetical protein
MKNRKYVEYWNVPLCLNTKKPMDGLHYQPKKQFSLKKTSTSTGKVVVSF